MGNKVNHPDHYQNIAGVEAIDILNDVVKDLPGKQAAMLWNSMKYLFRFQKKNGVEDLKKARTYLDYLINDMESTQDAAKYTSSETLENDDPQKKVCVVYNSKISGRAEVHYSMHMYAGTCTSITFTSELDRDMFIAGFFNKLGKKTFSIRDVLSDTNQFVIPNDADTFNVRLPWKDFFSRFRLSKEGDKYILEFIYKAIGRKK